MNWRLRRHSLLLLWLRYGYSCCCFVGDAVIPAPFDGATCNASPTFHFITSSLILHIRAVATSTRNMAISFPIMNCGYSGLLRKCICRYRSAISTSVTTLQFPFNVMLYSPPTLSSSSPIVVVVVVVFAAGNDGAPCSEKSCTSNATPPVRSNMSYFFVRTLVLMMIVSSSGRYVNLMSDKCDVALSTSTVLRYANLHRDNTRRTIMGSGGRSGCIA